MRLERSPLESRDISSMTSVKAPRTVPTRLFRLSPTLRIMPLLPASSTRAEKSPAAAASASTAISLWARSSASSASFCEVTLRHSVTMPPSAVRRSVMRTQRLSGRRNSISPSHFCRARTRLSSHSASRPVGVGEQAFVETGLQDFPIGPPFDEQMRLVAEELTGVFGAEHQPVVLVIEDDAVAENAQGIDDAFLALRRAVAEIDQGLAKIAAAQGSCRRPVRRPRSRLNSAKICEM